MEVGLGLPFMKEQPEGQCQMNQMNERGRRAWIIFLGAHTSRGEKMNCSIERVLTLSGAPEARITVPPVWSHPGGSLEVALVTLRFANRKSIT
jgi:hypothetical protein